MRVNMLKNSMTHKKHILPLSNTFINVNMVTKGVNNNAYESKLLDALK